MYVLIHISVSAFVLGVSADGLHGHGHAHGHAAAAPARRGGRQEAAPLTSYGAGADQATYGDLDSAASDSGADPLAMLASSIPGTPGEDYPILAEVPETAFSCEGQVDGGYYADDEAKCQVFHICTADGQGGLAKYSFLCPNGTIFNQNYFICDWWFNFDCNEAEGLYSKNEEIAAEREAASAAASDQTSYGAPPPAGNSAGAAAAAAPPASGATGASGALGAYEAGERAARKLGNRKVGRRGGQKGARGL